MRQIRKAQARVRYRGQNADSAKLRQLNWLLLLTWFFLVGTFFLQH